MNIAIFCPNWVGDMVMATPALRAVRTQYPTARIVAIVRPYVADVLEGLSLVDRVLLHFPRGRQSAAARGAARGLHFLRALRQQRCDVALLLPNSFRSAWWAWLSGAKRRVGFARNGRSWLLTDAVPAGDIKAPRPVLDDYLKLAARIGCRRLTRRMELAVLPEHAARLDQFWSRQSEVVTAARGLICLNPGGAFGAAKHWPEAHFAELGRRLAVERRTRVLVLCGPEERDMARRIVRAASHPRVVSLADEEPSIGLTKAAVQSADLLVTTDSGPRHFAPPFGVPVVTLFGPTHVAWSETRYDKSVHLRIDVPCGPCQQRVCPLVHHRCMRELPVDWAFRAAVTLLDQHGARHRAA